MATQRTASATKPAKPGQPPPVHFEHYFLAVTVDANTPSLDNLPIDTKTAAALCGVPAR